MGMGSSGPLGWYRAHCLAFGTSGWVASVQHGVVSSPSLGQQQAPAGTHKAAAVAARPRPGLRQVSFVSGFSLGVYFPGAGAGVLPGRRGGASSYACGEAFPSEGGPQLPS